MASVLSGLLFGEAGEDSVASQSSGYGGSGHSGSGIDRSGHRHSGHSGGGYGHSGGHSGGGYGGHSGGFSGHSGHSGHGKDECCPLVVDAICLAAILGSIAGASFLLARVIQIEIMTNGRRKKRKRKRSVLPSVSQSFTEFLFEGKSRLKDLHL